jgi:chemotaxis protein CheD
MGSKEVRYVGIGEMIISDSINDLLSAPNLGSCLGVTAYDPVKKCGGLIHCLLPLSKTSPERAEKQPCTFVDTGVVLMLNELLARGCSKDRLIIAVAGGSNINDQNNVFEIGKKNYTILRKILWKNNFLIKAEHVGESFPRTVHLDIESGGVTVKAQGQDLALV